jgi:DNA-binding LacI/PurR family transcriptional regulator
VHQLAALAGVSVKTVSNVVNGYAFVKPENRRRVEEDLSAAGYRPNLTARNLRRGRTGFIALVVPGRHPLLRRACGPHHHGRPSSRVECTDPADPRESGL